ncbi:MAG TPA: DUF1858 domain-containing protein [Bacteroides sp.]|nr:DUF1858 domain-containing protein [Bacteroides sp.]
MTVKNNLGMIITPKTKVGELLEEYPELEDLLISFSPTFQKLKNPVLRRTVGKIATLQQVAKVGNVSIDKLVNELRKRVGQGKMDVSDISDYESAIEPKWVRRDMVVDNFDAVPVINAGKNPMGEILKRIERIKQDEIFLFRTPFYPAPIIEKITKKGYMIFTEKRSENDFGNFVIKVPNQKD